MNFYGSSENDFWAGTFSYSLPIEQVCKFDDTANRFLCTLDRVKSII